MARIVGGTVVAAGEQRKILPHFIKEEKHVFKKLISSAVMASVVALAIPFTGAASAEASACPRHHRSRTVARHRTYRPATYASGYTDSYGNRYSSYTAAKKP